MPKISFKNIANDLTSHHRNANPRRGTREYISVDSTNTNLHEIADDILKIIIKRFGGNWTRDYTTENHTDFIKMD